MTLRRAGGLWWRLFASFTVAVWAAALVLHGPAAISLPSVLAALLIGAVVAALIARSLTRPVERIMAAHTAMADQLERRVHELEAQRNQAQAILDSMVEGVLALDREGRVLWFNASAQRLFAIPSGEAGGKRLIEVFRQPDMEGLVREVLDRQRPAVREVHAYTPEERIIRFQAAPCDGPPGGAALVLVAQDVTDVRRLEGMRREFVANVSHELKTPLTSIKGLIETLLAGALEDQGSNRRFVGMIEEDATRLTRLIDDLLELSQIESKAVPLRLEPVDLHALADELAPTFRQPLSERGVTLEIRVPPQTPPVRADRERLRQILLNLLDNAIKFNVSGGRVTVEAEAQGPSVQVSVADSGGGIPEADLPRIFERFYRVDKARSRGLGGTGLGLSIVKHLVELHQGTVEVASQPGQGSRFTVTLPRWVPPS